MRRADPEQRAGMVPDGIRRVQAFWGVALILALFVYTMQTEVLHPGARVESGSTAPARSLTRSFASAPGSSSVSAGVDLRPAQELFLFMMCDGETVANAIYDGPIMQQYVALYPGSDRPVIVETLAGRPTVFPGYARVFQSRCFETAVKNGAFP